MMRRAVRHLLSVIIPSVDDPVQTEEVLMLLHGARGVRLRRGDNLSEMILITFWRCAHIKVGGVSAVVRLSLPLKFMTGTSAWRADRACLISDPFGPPAASL